jgi:Zn-dependent alcohol dehydrogenase
MRDGTTRFHRDGQPIHHHAPAAFAERSVVPAETAFVLDPTMPLTEAALLGCAVMTGVGAVLNTARVRPGESVVVIGCGGVGLNIVQGASISGASTIVAIDLVDDKLRLARDLGATDTWNASDGGAEEAVRGVLERGADYVFEALGNPRTMELAVRLLSSGGKAVLVGMAPPGAAASVEAVAVTTGERQILGSWYGSCVPPRDFPALLDLYRAGRLKLDPLIGATCGLDDVNEAFDRMAAGEIARTVIRYEA